MHSQQIGETLFTHNGDLSGNVTIRRDGSTIEVPGIHLIEFVAKYVAQEKISQLEGADASEILGISIKLPEAK